MDKQLVRDYYDYILGEMDPHDFYEEMGIDTREPIPENISDLVEQRFENRWSLMDKDDKEYYTNLAKEFAPY